MAAFTGTKKREGPIVSQEDQIAAAQALSGLVDIGETPLAKEKEQELAASVLEILRLRQQSKEEQ